jgi:hypothetical protein
MRFLLPVCLLVGVVGAAPGSTAPVPEWWQAVGRSDTCTVWAVRPRLVATASHCVPAPGAVMEIAFRAGVGTRSQLATVVWDGLFNERVSADLAFLVPQSPLRTTIPISRWLPTPGETLETVGITLGMQWWASVVTARAITNQDRYGWVLVYQGEVGPGASGSPIVWRGAVVALHVAGADGPVLHIGIPAGTLARALRDYDARGPME